MNVAPHANKDIIKHFGSYWEELRNLMSLKKQDIFMEEFELPPELLNRFEINTKPNILMQKFQNDVGFDRQNFDAMSITSAVKPKISQDEISGSTGLTNIGVRASVLTKASNDNAQHA